MKRKVIQIANSTQLVSLPKEWADKHNVQKGDLLDVEEEGYHLLIKTEDAPDAKELEIDASGLAPRLADRFIARSYQKGYDKLTIKYDDPEIAIAIQSKVKELLGLEVMEQTKNKLVINNISKNLDIDFDSSLRRAFLMVVQMADECFDAFSKGDKKTLGNVFYKDFDVNKFCYFCLRSINKGGYKGPDTHVLYYLIESLEDVGDEYKALANSLAKIKARKDLLEIISKVNELTKIGYEFFYSPQKEKAVSSITLYNDIRKEIEGMLPSKDSSEAAALNSLDFIARMMYHFPTMRLDAL